MADSTDDILKARRPVHGEYAENARCTGELIRAMQAERNWPTLDDNQRHAVYMILHKLARIITGNADHEDHWDDIAGYAKLVADRIREPVIPYDAEDIYAALALGWGCDRDTALTRVRELQQTAKATTIAATQGQAVGARLGAGKPVSSVMKMPSELPVRPFKPEPFKGADEPDDDGSQHGSFSDEIARAIAEEDRVAT